ncbi:MAG: prepilin peptidase [Chloroflexi bacterium]|nr:prepilin peptidase [Chloroflexota bacterium]
MLTLISSYHPTVDSWLFFFIPSLLAGYVVNLVADALPARRPLREVWRAPLVGLRRATPRDGDSDNAWTSPWRYRLSWLMALLLGWLAFRRWGVGPEAALAAFYAWFFLIIAIIDLERRLVLNRMLAPAAIVIPLLSWWMEWPGLKSSLIGGALGFGVFFLLAIIQPKGMGMGDVKLAGVVGLAVGYPLVISAIVICFVSGGAAALILLIRRRFERGHYLAYAPYLVLGAWYGIYLGPR